MTPETLRAEGWTSLSGTGFTGHLGEIWLRGTPDERIVGFIATAGQSNNHPQNVHGGALMTFADIALGIGATDSLGAKHIVTAQLQLQFVAGGKVGEFVTCRPELVRCSSQLIFMRGLICAGDRTIASADGIWKILAPRSEP